MEKNCRANIFFLQKDTVLVLERIQLCSPTALTFSVFDNTERNAVHFVKLRYLYQFA